MVPQCRGSCSVTTTVAVAVAVTTVVETNDVHVNATRRPVLPHIRLFLRRWRLPLCPLLSLLLLLLLLLLLSTRIVLVAKPRLRLVEYALLRQLIADCWHAPISSRRTTTTLAITVRTIDVVADVTTLRRLCQYLATACPTGLQLRVIARTTSKTSARSLAGVCSESRALRDGLVDATACTASFAAVDRCLAEVVADYSRTQAVHGAIVIGATRLHSHAGPHRHPH